MIGVKSEYQPTTLEYIPYVYAEIQEFQELSKAYNIELINLMSAIDDIYNNYHIDSLNEYGCDRWEKILNLKTNASYTLEDRRFSIKVKLLGDRPYTLIKLKELIVNLIGDGNYKLNLNTATNHLNCKLNLGVKNQLNAVIDLIDRILPLNISYDVQLLFNTHEILGRRTHEQLTRHTHRQLREELLDD